MRSSRCAPGHRRGSGGRSWGGAEDLLKEQGAPESVAECEDFSALLLEIGLVEVFPEEPEDVVVRCAAQEVAEDDERRLVEAEFDERGLFARDTVRQRLFRRASSSHPTTRFIGGSPGQTLSTRRRKSSRELTLRRRARKSRCSFPRMLSRRWTMFLSRVSASWRVRDGNEIRVGWQNLVQERLVFCLLVDEHHE